jgi:trehalose 6-phosphate phosphatase
VNEGGESLEEALRRIAGVDVLLVASDYDGTLAPIVSDPDQALPDARSLEALRRLAILPRTHVAIISGRALRQLSALIGQGDLCMVGSHGSEFGPEFEQDLPQEAHALREELAAELGQIARGAPGLLVEVKPASVAFHYRNASDHDSHAALRAVLSGPARRPGVLTHHGKRVVELAVVEASKGHALEVLRRELSPRPDAVFFAGDDVTDENAFAALRPGDVGVKVGEGPTRAGYRVGDTGDVARVLGRVLELRRGR